MTQTNNPLFDTILASGDITKRANPQVMDWTTIDRRSPRCSKSGYSCNMIIIDDVMNESLPFSANDGQSSYLQKLLDDYKIRYDKKIAEMLLIPESDTIYTGAAHTSKVARNQNHD